MKSPSPAGKAQPAGAAAGRAPDGSRGCETAASLSPGIWGSPDSGGFYPGEAVREREEEPSPVPACQLQLSWQVETMGKREGASWDLSPAGAASFCGFGPRCAGEAPQRPAPFPLRAVLGTGAGGEKFGPSVLSLRLFLFFIF